MRPYAAIAKMRLGETGYFGLSEALGGYLLRALGLLMQIMIWRALIGAGARAEMTFGQLAAYTAVASALYPALNVRTAASSWLHEGQILALYLRPCPLFGQLIAHTVGGWVLPLMLYGVPVLTVAALFGAPLAPASAWFFPSLILCVSQGFAVDLLFACVIIRMHNFPWAVNRMREALNALLTGAVIPFAALPWGLGDILALSPLGTLAGAPLSILTGLGDVGRLIPAQVFWNAALWPLAVYCFARARERMVSYGG